MDNLKLDETLSPYVVKLLFEQLGIDKHLKTPSCDRSKNQFELSENNWKKGEI